MTGIIAFFIWLSETKKSCFGIMTKRKKCDKIMSEQMNRIC